jgi:hypothetical protein
MVAHIYHFVATALDTHCLQESIMTSTATYQPASPIRTKLGRAVLMATMIIAATISAQAQIVEFGLGAINITPIGTNESYMTLGVAANATLGVDTALGEVEIPGPPPSGVFMWSEVQLPTERVALNPKDIRPLRNERYIDTIELRVQWSGGSLGFVSPGMKPAIIDSAYIVDAVLDFPNNVFKKKLWSGDNTTTNNPGIGRFRLLVWYNGTASTVAETSSAPFMLGPVPFHDVLRVQGHGAMQNLRLIDMQGQTVVSDVVDNGTAVISTSHLPAGPYIVELTDANGAKQHRMIVRQ